MRSYLALVEKPYHKPFFFQQCMFLLVRDLPKAKVLKAPPKRFLPFKFRFLAQNVAFVANENLGLL